MDHMKFIETVSFLVTWKHNRLFWDIDALLKKSGTAWTFPTGPSFSRPSKLNGRTNTEVLKCSEMPSIEAAILKHHLGWSGHVIQMDPLKLLWTILHYEQMTLRKNQNEDSKTNWTYPSFKAASTIPLSNQKLLTVHHFSCSNFGKNWRNKKKSLQGLSSPAKTSTCSIMQSVFEIVPFPARLSEPSQVQASDEPDLDTRSANVNTLPISNIDMFPNKIIFLQGQIYHKLSEINETVYIQVTQCITCQDKETGKYPHTNTQTHMHRHYSLVHKSESALYLRFLSSYILCI